MASNASYLLPNIEFGFDGNDLKTIEEYVKKGSKTAFKMRSAFNYRLIALKALQKCGVLDNTNNEIFVNNFAKCVRTEELIAKVANHLMEKSRTIINKMIKSEENSKSDLDMNARVCYSHIIINTFVDKSIDFLIQCINKYPNEYIFYYFLSSFCNLKKDYKKGLNVLNKALELNPNDCELLYKRADFMRLEANSDSNDAIKAYLSFIEIAPKDHRLVPESYYAIACLLSRNGNQLIDNKFEIKSYYEKGLESEKNQLSFFIPYKSVNKTLTEIVFDVLDQRLDKTQFNPSELSVNKSSEENLSNDNTNDVIRKHREQAFHSNCDQIIINTITSSKPRNTKYSIKGLKEITLRDMKQKINHVFEGYFMKITLIEDLTIGSHLPFIRNVLQDENGETPMCFIHDLDLINSESIVQKTYRFGTQMYLINPHLGMASDGRPVISIYDTNCLIEVISEKTSEIRSQEE